MPRKGLLDCLDAKVRAGRLTRKQAEAAAEQVREMEERLARHKSRTDAEVEAERAAGKKLEADAKARRREQAFHLLKLKEVNSRAATYPSAEGLSFGLGTKKGNGVLAHFDASGKVGWTNWGTRRQSMLGAFHKFFADGIIKLRPRWLGIADLLSNSRTKLSRNVVHETFGEATGDADAALIARQWKNTGEFAFELANRAGADIRHRKDWFLPTPWRSERVRRVSFEEFKRDVLGANPKTGRPRLKRERVLSPSSGRPMTDMELEAALPEIHRDIATDGLASIQPGVGPGASAARKLEHHRLLQWATADDWLFIMNKYGDGDLYRVLTGHLEHMADEITLMEIFGPKHKLVMRQLIDEVRRDEALAGVGKKRPKRTQQSALINTVYKHATHELDRIDEAMFPVAAKIGQDTRSYLIGAQLGRAVMNVVADMKSLSKRARWADLPQWRLFTTLLEQAGPKGPKLRRWALRRAIVAENWTTRALAAKRMADEVDMRGFAGWQADAVMRASGLSGATQGGRNAFALEFYATLAEHGDQAFDALPEGLRRAMTFHRITPDEWDLIRTAPRTELEPGADFVDPIGVLEHPKLERGAAIDLSFKLMDMVNQNKDIAVITTRPIPRALLTFGGKRGTFLGELGRFTGMYKSFAVTFSMMHGQQALARGTKWGAAGYAVNMAIWMTLLGGTAITLRDLTKGRDPRDWTDPKFWGAALFQGGGLGVLGDFSYSLFEGGTSRHGHGLTTTLLGPGAGLLEDTARLLVPNVRQMLEGEETGFASEAFRFARRYHPGANYWLTDTVLDRILWDQLQAMADPDARRAWRRMEKRARTDYGQKFWWAPGDVAPSRAPDLSAIAGGSE